MTTKKSRTHEITIRASFDAPLSAREARYAIWNAIQDHVIYGDGKPTRRDPERGLEPFGTGKIKVRR